MFWVRIRLAGQKSLGVIDTWATIFIFAKKTLRHEDLKNIVPTAAVRMADGHVVHSCRDCEVDVPIGSRSIAHRFYVMDTEAFDFVLRTNFFVKHSQMDGGLALVPWKISTLPRLRKFNVRTAATPLMS